ncbi:CbtA family protein [Nocardioides daejeonensis]|uniref:CbtA family protein n=1 Tax=Nocardioides daejeonensis TaxID=1046556 RepID=UPI000D74AF7F|nr:CbtA family protein [Nocardioides daejeonensis]
MTARDFLIRGLIAGFIAGILGFLVAHQVGEPHVERAIALEEAGSTDEHPHDAAEEPGATHEHETEEAGHSHGDGETEVSRANQRTWGLLTGTLAVGTALGGLVGLIAAAVVGRIGRLTATQSTALVSVVGFVSFALVPFLKYPAAPPAVGSGDTIGERTALFFTFLAISVAAAVAAVAVARQLLAQTSVYAAVVVSGGLYLLVVAGAAALMPTVNELGDFPADTLWWFRLSSVFTLATVWGGIGVVLTGLADRESAAEARRELAASL